MPIIPFLRPPLVGFIGLPIEKTVAASRNTHLDLSDFTVFTSAEWAANIPKRLIIPAGVTINADAASGLPALRTGTAAMGGSLELIINGTLNGYGGAANSGVGGRGLAINHANVKLRGAGIIRGGGGGGGAGGQGGPGYYTTTGQDGPIYQGSYPRYYWFKDDNAGRDYILWNETASPNFTWNSTVYSWNGYTYYRGDFVSGISGNNYYYVYRQYPIYNYTTGGNGGAGGRGQGGDGANVGGSAGSGGGTNAGAGGTGGTGGTFGSAGATGATGAAGNNGAGAAGTAGGTPGAAIAFNSFAVDMTGWTGTTVGAVS